MKIRFYLYSLFVLVLLFTGCRRDDVPETYTILIYMAADNSMDVDVNYTIEKIKEGAVGSNGTTVIYLDRKGSGKTRLFKIDNKGVETLLKEYPEENSASTTTLSRVINETKQLVPADKYGFIFWSHSMGWYPALNGVATRSAPKEYTYIGIDDTPATGTGISFMEVDEIADAMPNNMFEYIWFDVCLMGSVDGLYEFRNKADYLIASPTEVLLEATHDASGVPYAKVMKYLFGGKEELINACKIYYDHYTNLTADEIYRSATIVMVDAKELNGLYFETRKLLSRKLTDVQNMNIEGIQVYHTRHIPQVFFDYAEFMKRITTAQQYTAVDNQLKKTVVYKNATPDFINQVIIDPAKYSGLSVYIPLAIWQNENPYKYYFNLLEWSGVYN
ncbi:MAG: clostripain-related cysteine peptidase [Dysgonamonadaceae bacterium]|nr:clostripain-related cysteine peptidase [Dysgonamonadaceae bacterium]